MKLENEKLLLSQNSIRLDSSPPQNSKEKQNDTGIL